jgi:hypothetical protein
VSVQYYHLAPVILNDKLYEQYGGRMETSTLPQRQAAYQIAEMQMIRELNTFLLPTTVTGTFLFGGAAKRFQLPQHHVISVDAVTILSQKSDCNCEIESEAGCAYIADNTYGYIDVKQLTNAYLGCGCSIEDPYQARIAYTAGLPTGVAADDASLHMALTIVAEIALLEIVDPAGLEGGPGDQGVQEYVSMGYGEKRMPLRETVFGNSPRANKAWKLVRHLEPYTALGLGRGV